MVTPVDCSIVPERSADPAEVRRLVRRDGAAILTGVGPTEEDARAAVAAVFGGDVARRFLLGAGDVVVIDNYRVLHGRNPYEGSRLMWRVWVWTTEGNGAPAGDLHSDTRYAAAG